MRKRLKFAVFCRLINGYLISQSLNSEKQGSACGKTRFMLTLFVGEQLKFVML